MHVLVEFDTNAPVGFLRLNGMLCKWVNKEA